MVFITTTKRDNFDCPMLEDVMQRAHPFFMVRLKHEEDPHGRAMQGVILRKPRDLPPEVVEALWMPEMRVV